METILKKLGVLAQSRRLEKILAAREERDVVENIYLHAVGLARRSDGFGQNNISKDTCNYCT